MGNHGGPSLRDRGKEMAEPLHCFCDAARYDARDLRRHTEAMALGQRRRLRRIIIRIRR